MARTLAGERDAFTPLLARHYPSVLRRLVATAFVATVRLARGKRFVEIEARPGEALILADLSGAPVYAARSDLDAVGYALDDAYAAWEHGPQSRQQLLPRIRARVAHGHALVAPAPLAPEARAQVDSCLARLLADSGGQTALLVHPSGALAAWQGAGDAETLALYCAIRAQTEQHPRDLSDLLMYKNLLMRELFQGAIITLAQVHQSWQLQLAGAANLQDVKDDRIDQRVSQAVRELEAVLPGG